VKIISYKLPKARLIKIDYPSDMTLILCKIEIKHQTGLKWKVMKRIARGSSLS
jgi:hypothetical protein